MEIDNIITLSNNKEYLLLDKTDNNGKNYFYAVGIDENGNTKENEYVFFEEIKENNDILAKEVKDKDVINLLLTIFTNNYTELVEEIRE